MFAFREFHMFVYNLPSISMVAIEGFMALVCREELVALVGIWLSSAVLARPIE